MNTIILIGADEDNDGNDDEDDDDDDDDDNDDDNDDDDNGDNDNGDNDCHGDEGMISVTSKKSHLIH